MTRTFTAVAGATSISAIQNEDLKTSDGLYFYTSDGDLMYVRSEETLLLLNNIYPVPAGNREYTPTLESRSYEV